MQSLRLLGNARLSGRMLLDDAGYLLKVLGHMKRHYGSFSGPRGALNPLGVKVPGVFSVELYNTRVGVLARSVETDIALPIRAADMPAAMLAVEALYEQRIGDWRTLERDELAPRLARKAPAKPAKRRARGVAS